MQVKWRQYELIFAVTVFMIMAGKALVDAMGAGARDVNTGMVIYYYATKLLLLYGLPLLLLVLVNYWLLPHYAAKKRAVVILAGAAISGWLLLSFANIFSYILQVANSWASGIYKMPNAGQLQRERLKGIAQAGSMVIFYGFYLWMRETVIKWIEQQRAGMLPLIACNRTSAVAFFYFSILVFVQTFQLITSDIMGIIVVIVVPAVLITILVNVYVLFPSPKFNKPVPVFLLKLATTPFIVSVVPWVVYILIVGRVNPLVLLVHFLLVFLIATPLSWLVFVREKGRLTMVQQLQKDLDDTSASLAFLRSQINPHFLFNMLNTLYGTALQESAAHTATGIQRLGDMMRFLLHDNNREQIPLSRELSYLQNFIVLQQLRIAQSKDIVITSSIKECTSEKMIAPMLLIPFVENAFKHGIRPAHPSFIHMHCFCDDKGVVLHVMNSVHPKKANATPADESGVGLPNVQQRLQMLYAGRHTLKLNATETVFEVHLHIELPDPA